MAYLRLAYRSVFIAVLVLIGIVLTPLVQKGTMYRTGLSAETTRAWHRRLTRAIGVRVTTYGEPLDRAALLVANHISWFDICALGSVLPARFLSKIEVKHWPLIGWLATTSGTLYIRRGAHASRDAIDAMAQAMRTDQNVCLFPEGTTTAGNTRRFHGRLLQSAIEAGVMVQPVVLFYPPEPHHDGLRAHPDILYIDDMSLGESMLAMLKSPDLACEIHFLEPVSSDGSTRDELAKQSERAIREKLETLLAR